MASKFLGLSKIPPVGSPNLFLLTTTGADRAL
jgi:hypothetical protein